MRELSVEALGTRAPMELWQIDFVAGFARAPSTSAKGPTAAFNVWHDEEDLLFAWTITVIAQHCRRDPLTSGSCTRGYTSRC